MTDHGIEYRGTSNRKDRDYVADGLTTIVPSPRMDEAKDFILDNVENGMEVSELEKMAKAAGISQETLKNARAELKKEKLLRVKPVGFGKV